MRVLAVLVLVVVLAGCSSAPAAPAPGEDRVARLSVRQLAENGTAEVTYTLALVGDGRVPALSNGLVDYAVASGGEYVVAHGPPESVRGKADWTGADALALQVCLTHNGTVEPALCAQGASPLEFSWSRGGAAGGPAEAGLYGIHVQADAPAPVSSLHVAFTMGWTAPADPDESA